MGRTGPSPGVAFVLAKDGAQWFVSSQNWIPVGGKFRVVHTRCRGDAGPVGGRKGLLQRSTGRTRNSLSGPAHLTQIVPHRHWIDVLFDEGLADATGQDEGQRAPHYFFVLGDGVHQYVGRRQGAGDIG